MPRDTSRELLTSLRKSGILPVMLTGDHPETARAIALQLGWPEETQVVTGDDLVAMGRAERVRALHGAGVVARVAPEQKLHVVEALQQAGRVVAMAGDGANDAAAIRAADVGVGIEARGSAAARNAADIVLTGGDLSVLVDAFAEGRALWRSVADAVSILIGGNAGEVGFSVLGTLLAGSSPLSTRQLLLVNLLTDMFPAMAVAVTPSNDPSTAAHAETGPLSLDVLGTPLLRSIRRRGVTTCLGAVTAYLTGRFTPAPSAAPPRWRCAGWSARSWCRPSGRRHSTLVWVTALGSAAVLAALVQTPGVSHFFGCVPWARSPGRASPSPSPSPPWPPPGTPGRGTAPLRPGDPPHPAPAGLGPHHAPHPAHGHRAPRRLNRPRASRPGWRPVSAERAHHAHWKCRAVPDIPAPPTQAVRAPGADPPLSEKGEDRHEGLRLPRPRAVRLGGGSRSGDPRARRRHRPRRRRHHLRDGPAHSQGGRARGASRHRARTRGGRRGGRDRRRRPHRTARRPRPRLLHHRVRPLPLLPRGHVRAVPGRRGWILGHLVDGTQAEYVRVPFADLSVYPLPGALANEDAVLLADIFPTAYEVGVLNGRVRPGDTVVVVGAGPVGLAAIATARLFGPERVVAVDLAASRLQAAKEFGADAVADASEGPEQLVEDLTGELGADVVIEAVGVPETFELCTRVVRPGGHVANVGVHGAPSTLHLEDLWIKNVTITTGLVDTHSAHPAADGRGVAAHPPSGLHTFALDQMQEAYDVFGNAAETGALKVVLGVPQHEVVPVQPTV